MLPLAGKANPPEILLPATSATLITFGFHTHPHTPCRMNAAAPPSISDAREPQPVEEGLVTRKVGDMHVSTMSRRGTGECRGGGSSTSGALLNKLGMRAAPYAHAALRRAADVFIV